MVRVPVGMHVFHINSIMQCTYRYMVTNITYCDKEEIIYKESE